MELNTVTITAIQVCGFSLPSEVRGRPSATRHWSCSFHHC